ncbi:alpha/beta fold hydrolase [Bacillus sp. X1(2014)]|uniref:alpha/beta fold hydrolase n=1 Tax=Bacillus sp. X1(2014) TaxID=1565991 RepID=UPI0011A7054F|nr:alpha/beta hydrolase [Bacillus sp. X1(2014)]
MNLGNGIYDGWVLANGIRTHYAWSGTEGPAVILLHGGGPGSSGYAGWRYMLPFLAEEGFRAIALDQLSMGWTDARPHAWPTKGHQSLVDHVRDFIDALCLDEVYLIGNSQGAYVAAKYAIEHPERVKKLVYIGSATLAHSLGVELPELKKDQIFQKMRPYDYTEEGMRNFLEAISYDKSRVTDELVSYRYEASILPGIKESAAAFIKYQEKMRREPKLWDRFSIEDSLPKLKIPGKFIWGKHDTFAPVEMGYALEKILPNIEFEYIDECGHQCQTDQPEIVNKLVCDFFKN